MGLQIEDIGELAYGGLVTGLDRWDNREARPLWKKYSTYAYLVPGVVAIGASAMNWMPRYSNWSERISHGFIYGFPSFVMNVVDHYGTTGSGSAVTQAEKLLRQRTTARKPIGQTTKPGFEDVQIY